MVVNYTPPTVTDNAPGATVVLTAGLGPGANFPIGTTIETYTATDASGNTVSASFNVTVNQIPPGEVTLSVVSDISDGTFGFSSPEPQFNLSVTTSGGSGQSAPVTIMPGTYVITAILPDGFGLVSGSCTDGDSTVDVGARTATVNLASGEAVTCTFTGADSRTKTVQTIQRFLKRRNDMLLSNGPNLNRQVNRLMNRSGSDVNGSGGTGFAQNSQSSSQDGIAASTTTLSAASGLTGATSSSRKGPSALGGPGMSDGALGGFGASGLFQDNQQNQNGSTSTIPFGFTVGDERGNKMSFSTSLMQVARAAAESKRRKLAGGPEQLEQLGIDGTLLASPKQYVLDVWVEGHLTFFDEGENGGESDGEFGVLYLGMDYLLSPHILVGALVQFDKMSEFSRDRSTNVEGHGWMVGPYATVRLTENLFVQTRAAWGRSSNDISPFLTYEDTFKTQRWLVEGTIHGRWNFGNLAFSPRASVGYIEENQETYVDTLSVTIPNQTVTLGQARFGPQVSYQIKTTDGSTLEPYAEFEGIWNFEESGTNLVAGTLASDNELRGKVGVGLRAVTSGGVSLNISGSYDGLGADDFEAYSGELQIRVPMN